MGTHFPGINSAPLDVRLWGGQITWTENITELSTMWRHAWSHHWVGMISNLSWILCILQVVPGNYPLLPHMNYPTSWTCLGIRNVVYFCCSIKHSEQTHAWGYTQIHLCWTSRTAHLKYNNGHLSGILGKSPGSQDCPWHELVWHRRSKGSQTAIYCKGWILISDHLEETIMNPLEILAKAVHWGKGDMPASFFPAQGSKLHYFSPRNCSGNTPNYYF